MSDGRWTFEHVHGGLIPTAPAWDELPAYTDVEIPSVRAQVLLIADEELGSAPRLLLYADPAVDLETWWPRILRWCASYEDGTYDGWRPLPPLGRLAAAADVRLDDPLG